MLLEYGFGPVGLPLGQIRFLDFDLGGQKNGLIFTSTVAVDAIKNKASFDLSLPVYCVGKKTESALRRAGFTQIKIVADTAIDLANALEDISRGKETKLVYLAGKDRSCDFSNFSENISVKIVEIYQIDRLNPEKSQFVRAMEEAKDGIQLHFSQKSTVYFFSLVKKYGCESLSKTMLAITISEKTSLAVENSLVKSVQNAKMPTQDSMIAVLRAICRGEK